MTRILLAMSLAIALAAWPGSDSNAQPAPSGPQPIATDELPMGQWETFQSRKGHVAGGMAWQMGLAVGETHDFVEGYSVSGFAAELRYFVRENMSVGASVGWTILNDKQRTQFMGENFALTGTQVRYFELIPLLATGHYYIDSGNERATPFVGVGVGAHWTQRVVDTGAFLISDDKWHFGVSPEIGVLLGGTRQNLHLAIRYNFATGGENEMLMNFNVGFLAF